MAAGAKKPGWPPCTIFATANNLAPTKRKPGSHSPEQWLSPPGQAAQKSRNIHWNEEKDDKSFFKHEIQFPDLLEIQQTCWQC